MSVIPPDRPFAAFEPDDKSPWTIAQVAHLHRRAALGATWERLQADQMRKPSEIVDGLLDFDPSDDPFNDTLDSLAGFVDIKEPRSLQSWWLHRMLNTERPLQEKIALFWHDHFATSAAKVSEGEQMHTQIEMFRQKGLGSFRDLLIEVGRDPAMLVWLDGRNSKKGKPNENYAREVMELFTLGVGNYTEADVKELARCFTGWTIRDGRGNFSPGAFDNTEKTILGQKANFGDQGAVDVLLVQPAASKHLSTKLLVEFVHPTPDAKLVDEFAGLIRKHDWQMKPILRTLLTSRVFYSDYAYRSRIKSPVELCVGLALVMGGKIKTEFVRDTLNRMGQSLLYPPNVKGWDGNEAWINANTYLVRMNYGWALAQQRGQDYAKRGSLESMLDSANAQTPEQVVTFFAETLLDGKITDDVRGRLGTYLTTDEKGKPAKFERKKQGANRIVRSMIRVMTAIPEFQLA